ncbi:MAG TPA: hypothetical protein VER33_03735 [Polyangiaceae bacterium]|nr:hypothetical protein [Polyangiaceae bacterium]
MEPPRVRLGELLVESQIITAQQLQDILARQQRDGRRLGTLLIEAELVTETQVTQILSQQLSVPWVSLYHIDFSRQLLNLVPHAVAEKYCLVPIFVRRVRGVGETLYVAMDDPSDEAGVREVSQYSGLPVRAMIAPPSDILAAIRVYYSVGKDTASLSEAVAELDAERTEHVPESAPPPAAPPPVSVVPSSRPPRASQPAPFGSSSVPPPMPALARQERITEPPDSGPQIEAREVSMPAPRRGNPPRMVTLTLLDGTQLNLPARTQRAPSDAAPKDAAALTASDLAAALRAISNGADASEILGEAARWEPLFAALLSLLLKKHLIADWEFVDELKKL